MAGKVEEKRKVLREKLITLAQAKIAQDGIGALRARDLAKEAGCATGAIYNIFDDLTDLILTVNALTFHRLAEAVTAALHSVSPTPLEQLIAMGEAYHAFAAQNFQSWRAIFEVERDPAQARPEWYLADLAHLCWYIDGPLAKALPDMDPDQRQLFTRTLFTSVHGIVLLGLDRTSATVEEDAINEMIQLLLRQAVRPL
jgi:AcrR family transcriptional regulator